MKNENYYDIKVHIDSIKDIKKGWKIEKSKYFEKIYQKYKNEKVMKIGAIGKDNKGKTYILSKLLKINIPPGMSIKIEGLSFKYSNITQFKDRKILLLDSTEIEWPTLISSGSQNEINSNIFKEKSRDKSITETFLQNYIIILFIYLFINLN